MTKRVSVPRRSRGEPARLAVADRRDGDAKYRSLFKSMRQGVFYQRADGSLIDANPAALEIFGLTREEFLSRTSLQGDWDVIDEHGSPLPGDRHPSMVALRTGVAVHDVVAGVTNARTKRRVWLLIDAIPEFRDGDSRPWQVFVTLHDITERKEALEILHAYRNITSSTPDGIALLDRDYRYRIVNRAYEGYSGRTKEQFVGSAIADYLGEEAFREQVKPNFDRCLAGETVSFREWFDFPALGRRFIDVTYFPYRGGEGRIEGVVANTRDITELHEAEATASKREARYRSLIDASADGFWLTDTQGRLLDVNEVYCRRSGYGREELLRMSIADLEASESREEVSAHIARAMAMGSALFETLHRCKDGSRWQVEINASYWPAEGGRFFVFLRDMIRRDRSDTLLRIRRRLSDLSATAGLDELMRTALDAAELHSGSRIAFFHFVEPDQQTLSLQVWSSNTMDSMCKTVGIKEHYPVSEAGVWADCLRQGRAVIHDDYARLPHRKGLPDGHADVLREAVVPIFRDDKVVAVAGVGNKASAYTDDDVDLVRQIGSMVMDLVDRKRAQEALQESERRWILALEGAGHGVWAWDPRGGRVFYSRQWKAMLGYDDQDIGTGVKEWSTRVHPDDLATCLAEVERHFRHETAMYRSEHRMRCKDGAYKWVLAQGRVDEWDAEGRPVRMVGTHTDIDDRRQMEERVRLSEEKLRSIFRAAPIGIGVVADRTFAAVNQALCDMLGYAHEELIGKSARLVYPTERDFDFVGREKYRQISAAGHGSVETHFRRRDGGVIDVLLSSTPIDESDLARGVTFTALDITRRKQHELELQRLSRTERAVGRSTAALLHAQDEGEYLSEICRLVVEICGYAMVWIGFAEQDARRGIRPAACAGLEGGDLESLNCTWADAGHGPEPPGIAIRTGKPAFARMISADAEPEPWRSEALKRGYAAVAAWPLLDDAGRGFGVITLCSANADAFSEDEGKLLSVLAEDLAFGIRTLRLRAAHTEAESQMDALRGELQRLVEQQVASQTAAGIAHELNQPLNAVTAYGQAALQLLSALDGTAPQLATAVEGMVAQAQQAGSVVRQLLAFFSRAETAAAQFELEFLAREAVSLTRSSGFRGAAIAVRAQADLPPVRVNRLQIEKVFLNLLRNSLEALAQSGPSTAAAEVVVCLTNNGDDKARVSIVDRGPGIAATVAARIFEPFFTTKKGGVGMGLQISSALVEAHGGRLWFEPTPGGGATFHFTLPYA